MPDVLESAAERLVDLDELAHVCYASWARRMDLIRPLGDVDEQGGRSYRRYRPRPLWLRLSNDDKLLWTLVAKAAACRVLEDLDHSGALFERSAAETSS
jgi:hypothetical protein